MRVKIHRGAHEIGGSCVEVEHDGQRIVLDVGRPLSAERNEVVPLPDVAGFLETDANLLGVLITHAHQDHWGLVGDLVGEVPVFIGEATARILAEAEFWTTGLALEPAGFLVHRESFRVGPFEITAYLNDHSAFDAYAMLVEAGGRRLFYTGDIRGHGRKRGIFEELLRKPPADVDVLLMEGTNIRPGDEHIGDEEAAVSEDDVEAACVETFRATAGLCLLSFSAQNIDRLVTMFRAARRSGRTLVVDLYAASIAAATENANIPRPGPEWPDVRVYVPHSQRVTVKKKEAFERVAAIKPYRLFEEDLAAHPERFAVMCNLSTLQRLDGAGALSGAALVWSLWTGYLKESSGEKLKAFLAEHAIPLVVHHTSGHASVPDLRRLATAIAAARVVPIHTFGADQYPTLFDNVMPQPDGVWWDV
jgi:ribonuclease J